MQDINAVVSSAFVLGEAVIEGFRDRELAKYTSGLRLDSKARVLTDGADGWEKNYVE